MALNDPRELRYPSDAFTNRELSWIDFNARVLEEARDPGNPLLERLKFLAITAGNLDEFFEVRIAGLVQAVADGVDAAGDDGLTASQQLARCLARAREFVAEQSKCWNDELNPALAQAGVVIGETEELWRDHHEELRSYLEERLLPVLTPLTIDPAVPFPRIENKVLCIAGLIRKPGAAGARLAVVTIPRVLPRLVPVRGAGPNVFVFVGELVRRCFDRVFDGHETLCTTEFRVTRNSNLYVNEEEAQNLLEAISEELRDRRKGDAVRLELGVDAPKDLEAMLAQALDLPEEQVFRVDGPVNLNRLMTAYALVARPDLKYPPFLPAEPAWVGDGGAFFDRLRNHDLLLHHPFDSFNPIVAFVQAAATDPKVLAIKLTLYRAGTDSPVIAALLAAARAGKQVTAVVELKARFDEATNIQWARVLEDAGVQVVYGIVGLKTHCKLCLLVREEGERLKRFVHIGTGNYNPATAKIYTDLSLFTARQDVTQDVERAFHLLTSHASRPMMKKLLLAPETMLPTLLYLIEQEAREAKAGRPAKIVAKCNALVDRDIIQALYDASRAGVQIDLVVRGICCLRAGVPGLSENIRVRSVVGRFLEHSRIYLFHAAGENKVFIGSADLMPRNLRGRVEVLTPIDDPGLRQTVRDEILAAYLEDRPKVRRLTPEGAYVPLPKEKWVDDRDPQTVLMQRVQRQLATHQKVVERPRRPRPKPSLRGRRTGPALKVEPPADAS
ncbi:MAG TPA: polyphosphate kinase 1 [Planctomycetota bacterium]|nr:polyphosphate kinase 1 [Planctomycetota bacterium]